MTKNPFASRLKSFKKYLRRNSLDGAVIHDEYNIRALTGVEIDTGVLVVESRESAPLVLYTDFRYIFYVKRCAPFIEARDVKKLSLLFKRVGYESSISHKQFTALEKKFKGVEFVDVSEELSELRSVKTRTEINAIRAAARLNAVIWEMAKAKFTAGMTERDMARIIRTLMIEKGDGEAFPTIVSIGKNAAECHHCPDDTRWDGREPVLVDMGVKLCGYASDMTRNLISEKMSGLYKKVYGIVERAQKKAICAARPGLSAKDLDGVARKVIARSGYAKAFGHSLGHGVGLEIHEAPFASKKSDAVLKPGMVITIEPGIYLDGKLGVRIEDLVLITEQGCEILSIHYEN